MKNIKKSLLEELFTKLAPKIGARVVMEPEWGVVGQIIFKNGRRRYFRGSTIDLNPVGASDIAKDKGYAAFFMRTMNYPTAPGEVFFSNSWAETVHSKKNIDHAYTYAQKIGLPVIVKPNSGSQGDGVAKVTNKKEFYQAMQFIFLNDRIALVQKPLPGRDYRVVVLDNKIISAYERIPLNVIGDGRKTIRQLLSAKQKQFIKEGRDTIIRQDDKRIEATLRAGKLNLDSVIEYNKRIYLLPNANLSSGGDAIDVTTSIHSHFKKIAIQLTKDMGLRLCGVDLIVNGDITKEPKEYWILEINAAPGLDHYVKTGKAQQKIVEDMYLEVLKAMA